MMRIVQLDGHLLGLAAGLERDPFTSEKASRPSFAGHVLNEFAFAAIDGANLIAAGGLVPIWDGRAEAWMLANARARKRELVEACRAAARILDKRQRDPAFRRIEAHVRCVAPWAQFAKALGFKLEGRLKAFDPLGRDYYLFSRVRECLQ